MRTSDKPPTTNCSLFCNPLNFFIKIKVEILPNPIPKRSKYCENAGKNGINTKGNAQHRPFKALVDSGHFVLIVILWRIDEKITLNFLNCKPNTNTKIINHVIPWLNDGKLFWKKNSLKIEAKNIEIAIFMKKIPKARLTCNDEYSMHISKSSIIYRFVARYLYL